MSDMPGLDFDLGEMADTIRDTTRALRHRQDRADRRRDRRERPLPDRAVAADGRARAARDHRRGAMGRARPRLSRACRRAGGSGARLGLGRALSYGAHSNLCVNQIRRWANDEQKAKYLPKLISGEHVGALAMSEAGAGQRRRLDEAQGREIGQRLPPQRHQILDHQRANMPTRWWSMPRPARAAAGITTFLIEKGMDGFSIGQKIDKCGMRGIADQRAGVRRLLRPRREHHGPGEWRGRGADERARLRAHRARRDPARDHAGVPRRGRPLRPRAQAVRPGDRQLPADPGQGRRHVCRAQFGARLRLCRWPRIATPARPRGSTRRARSCWRRESAFKVAGEAVQALGGAGYTKDWPVERFMRDAKLLDIGAGTNEIRRMLIGREMIGA